MHDTFCKTYGLLPEHSKQFYSDYLLDDVESKEQEDLLQQALEPLDIMDTFSSGFILEELMCLGNILQIIFLWLV